MKCLFALSVASGGVAERARLHLTIDRFWSVTANFHWLYWVDLCRWPTGLLVKSHAISGQSECKRVVMWSAISHARVLARQNQGPSQPVKA